MRLLDAQSKQFAEFFERIPPYAILSHTWGSNELTFKQMEQNGYIPSRKIDGCCEQALKDRLKYVWVDTCCIDKSSSAELSEAINSMWDWYRRSQICYVYLSDVPPGTNLGGEDSAFSKSRWFTRGWTLQELIAPKQVEFYDESWNSIGRKSVSFDARSITKLLSRVTQIDVQVLEDRSLLGDFSVAQRMSWAARRTTTRVEDVAYSLLGLFGINMPLLYGEGTRAFSRLQEEILKASDDESIFAWDFGETPRRHVSLFAVSPLNFASCGRMVPSTPAGLKPSHYTLTNKGLYIETSICYFPIEGRIALARLNCATEADGKSLAVALLGSRDNDMIFSRHSQMPPILVPSYLFSEQVMHVYIHRLMGHRVHALFCGLRVKCSFGDVDRYKIPEFYPPNWREILTTVGLSLLWHQPKNLDSGHQDILFLVDHAEWPNFTVWLDYKFSLEGNLQPQELKCRAAFVAPGKTLAEIVLLKRGSRSSVEGALDWKEALYWGDVELRFEIGKEKRPHGELWIARIQVNPKHVESRGLSGDTGLEGLATLEGI